jgi:hypothetical protein
MCPWTGKLPALRAFVLLLTTFVSTVTYVSVHTPHLTTAPRNRVRRA